MTSRPGCRLLGVMVPAAEPTTTVLPDRPPVILVVDEDEAFLDRTVEGLTESGYTAVHSMSAPPVAAPGGRRQAVVLGTGESGDGWRQAFWEVRRITDAPALLAGAETVEGLEAGADACLPRDCSARQLAARLQAIIRRAAMRQEIVIDDLRIALERRRAILAGRELSLTPGQFDLLLSLAKACGRVKTRDDLYAEFRARAYGAADRAVDVQVSCLRRKLGDDPRRPRFIQTVRSAGYMLVSPGARENLELRST